MGSYPGLSLFHQKEWEIYCTPISRSPQTYQHVIGTISWSFRGRQKSPNSGWSSKGRFSKHQPSQKEGSNNKEKKRKEKKFRQWRWLPYPWHKPQKRDSAIKTSMATTSSQSVHQPLALQESKLNQDLTDPPFSMVSPVKYKSQGVITKTYPLNLPTLGARPVTVQIVPYAVPTDIPTMMATTKTPIIIGTMYSGKLSTRKW